MTSFLERGADPSPAIARDAAELVARALAILDEESANWQPPSSQPSRSPTSLRDASPSRDDNSRKARA